MPLSYKIIKSQRLPDLPLREICLHPVIFKEEALPGDQVAAEAGKGQVLLEEAENRASEILRQAEERAQAILASARAEAGLIQDEAKKSGFQAGYREGMEAWQKEKSSLLQEAQKVVKAAWNERESIIRSTEGEVVELAMEIARKIMHSQLRVSPETVVEIARQALNQAPAAPNYTLLAAPEDLEMLRQNREGLQGELPEAAELLLQADEGISRGGCLVKNERGMVEATLEGQLTRVAEALKGAKT